MLRRFVCLVLVFSLVFIGEPKRQPIPEAQAAAVAVVPAAAWAALALAALVIWAAYQSSVINQSQYSDYDAQIDSWNRQLAQATEETLEATMRQVVRGLTSMATVTSSTCLMTALVPLAAFGAFERRSSGQTERRTNVEARARAAECTGTMSECCGDFLRPFEGRMQRSGDSVKIFRDGRMRDLLCCFNWDHRHHGLEIFNDRGIHQGERGCDDFNSDPCRLTPSRGTHGLPQPSTHRPRGLCAR
jgi:hypothetical protein